MTGHTKWSDVRRADDHATGATPDDPHVQRLRAQIELLQEENTSLRSEVEALRGRLAQGQRTLSAGTWKKYDPKDYIKSSGVGARGLCGSVHCTHKATWTYVEAVTHDQVGRSYTRHLPRCDQHGPDAPHLKK